MTQLEKIQQLLDELYCFEPEKVKEIMKRVPYMNEEGQDQLIAALEEGAKEQANLIQSWTRKTPEFGQELVRFMDETSKKAIGEFEQEEQASAEEILTTIE